MILTCPQCATRYQADGSKFPAAGRNVRCAKCGHVWHQLGPVPEPDPEAEISVEAPEPAPQPEPAPEPIVERPRVAAFAPPAPAEEDAYADDAAAPAHAARRGMGRFAVVAGWVGLVVLVLVIGTAAVSFRDSIATWLPQTSTFYNAAGLPVTPHSLDFIDYKMEKQLEDGQQVLAVTGKIVNRSNHELSVPLVRVALFDGERHELYHWTFVPGVSTLEAGGTAKFRTRLSSPPAATRDIELRFAKAGE